ncbi:hypothetical protein [Celeribacter sp.]|uniref:hypothetical protein n=1 Tax=Celeribacter sp. TaxID=1890673 RepID=UPI003A905823
MTVKVSKEEMNLREELNKLRAQVARRQEPFWFDGNGADTSFALPHGWKPKFVYVDGALYREGASEDYTVTFDGFVYTVEFAVAPSTVDVGIICEGGV